MTEDKGLRYNEGKIRLDLITPEMISGLGGVLTAGSNKYEDRNWEKGMKWSTVIASLKRHLLAIETGEDYDKETGQLHSDHVMTNAGFLSTYYRTHPDKDDRPRRWNRKVAIDIDGVIADFGRQYASTYNVDADPSHWFFTYDITDERWKEIIGNKDFWLSMPTLLSGVNMPFEPCAYVTSRPVPKNWVEDWLEKHSFPCNPVVIVGEKGVGRSVSKVEAVKKTGADYFIEDNFDNFVDLQNHGVCCFLLDRPYNKKFDVGHFRVKSLTEFKERFLS